MPLLRYLLVVLAVMRGMYGLRSPIAGFLHQAGIEGQLGYSVTITRMLAETGWALSVLSLALQLGYFLVAWAIWTNARRLLWLALAVYLVDQAMWIGFSVRPEDVAVHQQARVDQAFDPEMLDWILFMLETLIAAGALALGIRHGSERA
ncbi:hypothetical protein [uncultured Maricaulis sp.]|uniref:hypothetical protein n=1 Tax=uncultured Maricaulis sp. TaxID=174710 RepID=UPI0025F5A02D|nr:hypothetical protein [uncultured Maricaulis sp.]